MTNPTAGYLKRLTAKQLKDFRPKVLPEYHYLLDRIIESKRTGFGVYTDPSKAGKKGSKAKWGKKANT